MIHGQTGRTRHTGQTVKSSMDIVLYSLYSSQSKKERKIGMAKRTRAAGLFVCGVHKNPIRHLAASEPPPSQQFSCFYFLPRFSTQTAFALFRGVVIFVPLVSKMSSKAQLLHLKPNQPNTTTRIPWTEKKELFFYCTVTGRRHSTHTHKRKGREKRPTIHVHTIRDPCLTRTLCQRVVWYSSL